MSILGLLWINALATSYLSFGHLFDPVLSYKLVPSALNNCQSGPFRKHKLYFAACISEGSRDCKIRFALDYVVSSAQMYRKVGGSLPSIAGN